ncbi:MAG: 6,7-dimethyl-8-ribityllumazine synthase [Deltaproteobacteria bacterium]|nr:MAG: 6,7-dimethyl-8-ribityllumazine synthase [Deltaproteobacteria bacterium]
MNEIVEGSLQAGARRYAIVIGRFNTLITERLAAGAEAALRRHGADPEKIVCVRVPGAFEIPLAAKRLAESGRFDAIVCVGAVIRGGTPHFERIAAAVTSGLGRVMLDSGIPVTFGILTTDTVEQAIERAGTKMGNKGEEAALAAIEMADLMARLEESGS